MHTQPIIPSTGVGKSGGVFSGGGILGRFSVATQTDLDNPDAMSTSVGVGVGAGAFSGTLVCYTAQFCFVN